MISLPKRIVARLLARAGYEVRRARPELGQDALRDMARLTEQAGRPGPPVVFDVGANRGQSIWRFREAFGNPIIHAFEPAGETFRQLCANTAGVPDLKLNLSALGASAGELTLVENTSPDMSSILPPGEDCWGAVRQEVSVPVRTVDDYCAESGVQRIDVLKTDTQGFDLEVIRGAERMVRAGRVHLIFMEIIFSKMYRGLPGLDEIYRHLWERDFRLVSFYEFNYQNNRAGWTDALFAHTPP